MEGDDVGNGVRASGNRINNNRANNSGIGAGAQNFGRGAGSNYVNSARGNFNVGPGAGGVNSGQASGSTNTFKGPANFSSEHKASKKSVKDKNNRIRRKTKSASIKTSNAHDVEKDEATESDEVIESDHDSKHADGNEEDNMFDDVEKDEATERDEVIESDQDSKHADGNEEDNMFDGSQNLVETSKKLMPSKDKMDIEELIPCNNAKKAMIKDAIVNLCAAMRHMDLTLLDDMDEKFFYLFWDAIDKIERINIEVGKVRVHFLNLTKVYLGKSKFGIAGGDMTSNLDEQTEAQAKRVENMKKSFTETQELIHKLEARLKLVEEYLKSLNQGK